MGTCILDLFPDVQEQLDLLMDQNFATQSYPVAEFIVVFGFLLVLTMEQIVLDYKEQSLLNRSVLLFTCSIYFTFKPATDSRLILFQNLAVQGR